MRSGEVDRRGLVQRRQPGRVTLPAAHVFGKNGVASVLSRRLIWFREAQLSEPNRRERSYSYVGRPIKARTEMSSSRSGQ
jgi:hypothetical protein